MSVNLKKFREKQNLTQARTAELAGCSKNHLSALERGIKFPSPALIDKLCEILDVKPWELLLDETDRIQIKKQKDFVEYVMDSIDKDKISSHSKSTGKK